MGHGPWVIYRPKQLLVRGNRCALTVNVALHDNYMYMSCVEFSFQQ